MGMSAPLINAIVNNALLHSNSCIKQMSPEIIHILCFCGRLAVLQQKCDSATLIILISITIISILFVMNVLRPGLFGGQKSGSFTGLLHYCTFRLEAANDAQNVRLDTACGKDNDKQNL